MTDSVAGDDLRQAFANLAVGVCLLGTTDVVGRDVGLTVTSVTSVSLRPAMCLVCVRRDGFIHDSISVSDGWTISMLSESQQGLADYAARHRYPSDTDDFTGFPHARGEATGAIWFTESLCAVECQTSELVAAGDHTLVLGTIVGVAYGSGRSPLLRLSGEYQTSSDLSVGRRN